MTQAELMHYHHLSMTHQEPHFHFSFIWSEYWHILTKPFSDLRQWAEQIPGKGGALSIIAFNSEVLIP